MRREKKIQIIILLFVFGVTTFSCKYIAIPGDQIINNLEIILCATTGGTWVGDLGGGKCERSKNPQNENSGQNETDPESPVENGEQLPESGLSFEDCFATPDMYKIEFTNVNDDGSNQSKTVCQGDFVMTNTSDMSLSFKYYIYSSDGTKIKKDEWLPHALSLEPGGSYQLYFGHQTWTDGNSTHDTYPMAMVFINRAECSPVVAYENIVNEFREYVVFLDDPCH